MQATKVVRVLLSRTWVMHTVHSATSRSSLSARSSIWRSRSSLVGIDQSQRSISPKSNSSSFCPLGDKNGEGTAYCNIGIALYSLSRYDEALEYYKKHLKIAQQTGENWPITAQYFEKSNCSLFCPLGDKSGEGTAYGNIGCALESLSRYDEALEYHKKNVKIAQQTGEN
jgi:tetratricopeptide (TPR) repeat protein